MTTGHAQDAEQPETGITPGDKGAFRDVLSKDHARRGKPPVSLRAGRNTSVIACATGCPLNTSDSTMQLASVGMYSTVSIETATCDSRL